jgi:hypothetical protein
VLKCLVVDHVDCRILGLKIMFWVFSASRTSLTQKKKTKKKESPIDRAKMKRMQGF